ncbi:MAG: hypothetical protein Fur0037_14140 [Planctomycetota bacterium]
MDIGNVRGPSDRALARLPKAEGRQEPGTVFRDPQDAVVMSPGAKSAARSIDVLAARARQEDPDRVARMRGAAERLADGTLDSADVHRAVAERLLRAGFLED